MQHLCAPWRSEYFSAKKDSCVFCEVINSKEDDEKNGVLFRAKH
ncbi:MAG: HIT domain-containing protein, partial [Campylobacter sp.]|nr:HIT domain-containing protein [Campylobacter sp.]